MSRSRDSGGKNKLPNTADKENKDRAGPKLGSTLTVTSWVARSKLLTYLSPGVVTANGPLGWWNKAELMSRYGA